MGEVKRCKHEPADYATPADALFSRLRCKHCDMEGTYSNGRRMSSRPRKIIWFRRRSALSTRNPDHD